MAYSPILSQFTKNYQPDIYTQIRKMDAESTINTSMLENKFRDYIKQYRALLRWGVDKVFQDSRIDKHFNDVRHLIDARETEKASILLSDLKKQINYLENQYPDQKNEIEKELFVRIQQLESIIEKTTGIEADQIHLYLQTLEIARVAMQNDDWAEAKVKIEAVEMKVLTPNVIEKTRPGRNQSVSNGRNTTTSVVTSKKVHKSESTQKSNKQTAAAARSNVVNKRESNATRRKPEPKPIVTQEVVKPASPPTPLSPSPSTSLSPIAKSVHSIREKSSIGRLISLQELQKTLNTIEKSQTKTVRIGLFANANTINREVSSLSKRELCVKETGTQVVLLRLSISRELTIYLVGVPINKNSNFQQLVDITSQFSALFINTSNIDKSNLQELSTTLSTSTTKNKNVYLKKDSKANLEMLSSSDTVHTFIEDENSRFVEDAAIYMSEYSDN